MGYKAWMAVDLKPRAWTTDGIGIARGYCGYADRDRPAIATIGIHKMTLLPAMHLLMAFIFVRQSRSLSPEQAQL